MVVDQPTTNDRVRLHITPFTHDLLDKLLPASLRSQASDISFHHIQTFPERGFGYVELPAMEAQKLKKKLNGTTLKGSKLRVEEAKPAKKRKSDQAETTEDEKVKKRHKKERKRTDLGVVSGHQLEEGRIVKRGWVEDANAKRKHKNKSTEGQVSLKDRKLRFKTAVPSNVIAIDSKAKKDPKRDKTRAMKRTKANVVVNEFSRTSKLVISGPDKTPKGRTLAFSEGKGWLDENGALIEAEPLSKERHRNLAPSKRSRAPSDIVAEADVDVEMHTAATADVAQQATSLSSEAETEADTEATTSSSDRDGEDESTPSSSDDKLSSSISTILPDKIKPQTTVSEVRSTAKEVHPLEALYKRPKEARHDAISSKKPAPIDTSFSFFGPGEVEADEHERQLPQTPHTRKDLEWRSIRSAAPTPDTAGPGKRFSFALADDDVEDEDKVEMDADEHSTPRKRPQMNDGGSDAEPEAITRQPKGEEEEEEKEESEFRKWFYENRGDLNRAWKKRRREEKKLQRQRENRRLSRKVA